MLKNKELIAQMTLAEKASLMSGANFWNTKPIERLGVPSVMLTDGPHGLRKQGGASDHLGLNASVPATCFPTASALANSWDPELLHQVGQCLGAESVAEEVSVLLGPGLNIKRNPLAGRNFEYFSEDPLLTGELSASFIQGVQSTGVAACPKHFAVNSQETHRMSVDEIVDTRAMHEIYLEGFRLAVTKGQPWTLMTSYNKVNGTYANEHEELLDQILRKSWGFDGMVVTDWGGNNDRVDALRAGNDLEMPSSSGTTDQEIIAAIEAGTIAEEVLDRRVDQVLTMINRTAPHAQPGAADLDEHHEFAIKAAQRSIVLLKNKDAVLPLGNSAGKVAIIGEFAQNPRYQGAGSSLVNPTKVIAPLEALSQTDLNIIGYEPGFKRLGGKSKPLREKALWLAAQADTVLLFLGLDEAAETEGLDRSHMRLADNQLQIVRDLIDIKANIVVVLAGGSPVELPFTGAVNAIVHGYLPGQGGGQALADVITGKHNPGGKLAETYPVRYRDVASAADFAQGEATAEHRESIYVGYRYYDKVGERVRFPFGHGLSYTTFAYANLAVTRDEVTLTVTNTGSVTGEEIVQIYVEAPAGQQFRALRELRGFAKVSLDPGESQTVTVALAEHAFAAYDVTQNSWQDQPGEYSVLAGASSRDIRLRTSLQISDAAATPIAAYDLAELPHYVSGRVQEVTGAEFEKLLGRRLPAAQWPTRLPLTRNSIVAQCKGRGGAAGLLYSLVMGVHKFFKLRGKPIAANYVLFALSLPFRSVSRMSAGNVSEGMLDGILLILNKQTRKGVRLLRTEAKLNKKAQAAANRSTIR